MSSNHCYDRFANLAPFVVRPGDTFDPLHAACSARVAMPTKRPSLLDSEVEGQSGPWLGGMGIAASQF